MAQFNFDQIGANKTEATQTPHIFLACKKFKKVEPATPPPPPTKIPGATPVELITEAFVSLWLLDGKAGCICNMLHSVLCMGVQVDLNIREHSLIPIGIGLTTLKNLYLL